MNARHSLAVLVAVTCATNTGCSNKETPAPAAELEKDKPAAVVASALMSNGALPTDKRAPIIPEPSQQGVPKQNEPVDFYGKKISFLKLFGVRHWTECSPGRVDGTKIYHAAGVLVDRSLTPNAIYVADTGNNRILGFRSYGNKRPDLIFGQPDEFSSAPNGDCNVGRFGKPSATSLCLLDFPGCPNTAEQWMRLHFDVDGEGNLYVPDVYNHRVLVYRAPFSPDKTGGKGDTIPDLVIGQADFTSNGVNRGRGKGKCDAQSLFLSEGALYSSHLATSFGVSVDPKGNVWVADGFNHRVLRFPKGKTAADLVLGQPSFEKSSLVRGIKTAPLNQMCVPTLARVNPATGEVYVLDEYAGEPGGFPARILVFRPPFKNGQAADRIIIPKQRREGDYAKGYRFTHATGLVFNPVKTDDWIDEEKKTHRYRDGEFWVHEGEGQTAPRTLLLDKEGNILLAIGAPDVISYGGRWYTYQKAGMKMAASFNLGCPGGTMGFDSDNNIYLADEEHHRIARYALPFRARRTGDKVILPKTNGGLFPGTRPNSVGPAHSNARDGVLAYKNQLIVRDLSRFMIWNDYLNKSIGAPADMFPPQKDGWSIKEPSRIYANAMIGQGVDHLDRLWMAGEPQLTVHQLPLKANSKPLQNYFQLYWADEPDKKVDNDGSRAIAFEASTKSLWLFDLRYHRLLRIRLPDNLKQKLLVDAVIGQKNKTDKAVNRGMKQPDAASLGDVADIKFDRHGNLFVVDNTYESHPNGRIIVFLAEDLAAIKTMFPPIQAKKVYVAERFDQPTYKRTFLPGQHPRSPVNVAFNSRNEMVVGNDGYDHYAKAWHPSKRHWNQLYLYRRPLEKATPDAVIELPLAATSEITFDVHDNLIVQDGNKVWVINYDRDPAWLRPLK